MSDEVTARVESWGAGQDPPLSFSEAVRALIERGLGTPATRKVPLLGGVSSGEPKQIKRKR